MKVLVSLAFEEGDALGEVALTFADGSRLVLSHEQAAAHVELEHFKARAPVAPAAPEDDES